MHDCVWTLGVTLWCILRCSSFTLYFKVFFGDLDQFELTFEWFSDLRSRFVFIVKADLRKRVPHLRVRNKIWCPCYRNWLVNRVRLFWALFNSMESLPACISYCKRHLWPLAMHIMSGCSFHEADILATHPVTDTWSPWPISARLACSLSHASTLTFLDFYFYLLWSGVWIINSVIVVFELYSMNSLLLGCKRARILLIMIDIYINCLLIIKQGLRDLHLLTLRALSRDMGEKICFLIIFLWLLLLNHCEGHIRRTFDSLRSQIRALLYLVTKLYRLKRLFRRREAHDIGWQWVTLFISLFQVDLGLVCSGVWAPVRTFELALLGWLVALLWLSRFTLNCVHGFICLLLLLLLISLLFLLEAAGGQLLIWQ